ncbi:MAG: hypothetical protein QM757_21950 [Paludibaculum sp.]
MKPLSRITRAKCGRPVILRPWASASSTVTGMPRAVSFSAMARLRSLRAWRRVSSQARNSARGFIEEVAEDVNAAAGRIRFVGLTSAQFEAADEAQSPGGSQRQGFIGAAEGVVIGDGQRFQAQRYGVVDDLGWCVGAVTGGGVGVEIDH